MKLPSWIRPATATTDELASQRDAARDAHAAAVEAAARAQDAFDLDASSERALLGAREAERLAAEHLGRADRLLTAGQDRDAAAERERKRAELDASRKAIGDLQERLAGPLAEAEAEAMGALVDARLARVAAGRELLTQERSVETLLHELEGRPRSTLMPTLSVYGADVARVVEKLLVGLPGDSPRIRLMRRLVPTSDDYR